MQQTSRWEPSCCLLATLLFGFSEQFLLTVNTNNVLFPKNQNLHLSFQGQLIKGGKKEGKFIDADFACSFYCVRSLLEIFLFCKYVLSFPN